MNTFDVDEACREIARQHAKAAALWALSDRNPANRNPGNDAVWRYRDNVLRCTEDNR